MAKKGFHDVYCCGEFLASVPASTAVKCMNCNKWQKVPGREERDKTKCMKQPLT